MPDQNAASDEHALMQEITAPLTSLPDDPVPDVANVDFPIVLRGYDRLAVDAYVKRTSQLVAELNAGRSPQAAVRRALERVGEDVSGILQRAHDTAEQITSQSRSEAEDRLEGARKEAGHLVETARAEAEALLADSKQRLRDLDSETDRIWEERHRIVEDARSLASQLLAVAEEASARFPAEEPASQVSQPFDAEDEAQLPGDEDDQLPEDAETMVLGEEATAVLGEESTAVLREEPTGETGALGGGEPLEDEGQRTQPIEQIDPLDHDAGH